MRDSTREDGHGELGASHPSGEGRAAGRSSGDPGGDGRPKENARSEVGQEPGAGGASGDAEEGEVERLRRELEALDDRHLRLAAEYDNYRRRSQVELGSSAVRAQAALVAKLLDPLDDLERVTSLDPESASVESVLEGVALVERKVHHLLEEAGLESLEPEGERFDPAEMEAMARVPADSSEDDDTVADVFQRGFRFRGHLVRPARVSVRKHE